jgi:hypothetical protein
MVGIAPQVVIFSLSMSCITCSGSKRPSLKTSFEPIVIWVQTFECRPPTWKRGEVSSAAI